jgi:hypothetical protein
MAKWLTLTTTDEGDRTKVTVGLELKLGEWLAGKLFGRRRIGRIAANARVTGSASESITRGPLEIIVEDSRRRPKS